MQKSIIKDIFGGVYKTEFTLDQSKRTDVQYEPFYVVNLEKPRDCDDLQQCLDSFFQKRVVKDYQHLGRRVNATHRQLISKLPNVLCIQLKRFIWSLDHPIKMRDYVAFDPVIEISQEWLAPNLHGGRKREYRLFSVVEHLGEFAHRGHYINYALDSEDQWKQYDDTKVSARELQTI